MVCRPTGVSLPEKIIMSGPVGPFTERGRGTDGTLYLSADAEGSVLALYPQQHH